MPVIQHPWQYRHSKLLKKEMIQFLNVYVYSRINIFETVALQTCLNSRPNVNKVMNRKIKVILLVSRMITSEYILELSNVFHSGQVILHTHKWLILDHLKWFPTFLIGWGRHLPSKGNRNCKDWGYFEGCFHGSSWGRIVCCFGIKR